MVIRAISPHSLLVPTTVVGYFLMQAFAVERVTPSPITTPLPTAVLGTSLVVDLEQFPELNWIETYLTHLHTLQHDRLAHAIQAITQEGEVYRDYWIETYTKRKNGKQYTYPQLRWLTGELEPLPRLKPVGFRLQTEIAG